MGRLSMRRHGLSGPATKPSHAVLARVPEAQPTAWPMKHGTRPTWPGDSNGGAPRGAGGDKAGRGNDDKATTRWGGWLVGATVGRGVAT